MIPRVVSSLCVLLFGATICLVAQEKAIEKASVPAAVLKAFADAYPKAVIKGCKTESEKGKKFFEVESLDGKTKRDLLYTADGTVVEVEESVEMSQVPDAVTKALKKDFPSGKIVGSEKTTHGGTTSFEFVVKSGNKKVEVAYSPEGKQTGNEEVKATKESSENEEEDD